MTVVTTRQDKVLVTLNKLYDKLDQLKNGAMDIKFQKKYKHDEKLYGAVVEKRGHWGSIDYMHDTSKMFQPRWKYERDVEIINVRDQIRRNEKKLEDAKRLDDKETAKIEKTTTSARTHKEILDNLPEPLVKFMEGSKIKIYASYLKHRKQLLEMIAQWEAEREGMTALRSYEHQREHEGKFDSYKRRLIASTEAQLKKEVERDVEYSIVDLVYRVQQKVGKITDASHLKYNLGHINGIIVGEQGEAHVQSVLAGGYNIQCLHVRTLVK